MQAIFRSETLALAYSRLYRVVARIALTLHWTRLRAQAAIARIEADFETVKQIIENAWMLFLELAEKIKRAGVWRLHADNWHSYCRQKWNIDSSRLSQLRSALPYASAILSAGLGTAAEGHIRLLKKHVPLESPKMPQAWQLGQMVAKAENRAPTEAIFHHAHEVLLEAEQTNGMAQIDGAFYDVSDTSQAILAVKARIKEVQRIAQEGQAHRLIEVTAVKTGEGIWQIKSDEALPKVLKLKVYI